ncbi:putative membrane protein [Corynebacterium mustelae]|uniref:Putative membrane protein n=1 Tax=Corynebacterium mustelae TaxID=571915 RepID=A0A0G3GZ79_9CORY|nr:DoxX family protein [Corynebacterium mustelae]AKK05830.1 putative membrane protein [Corynebacterium mustelae]
MIRKFARPMVASVYIADGADTILNTQAHVEGAEALMRRLRTVVSRSTFKKLPQDPVVVARTVGGVKVGAGTMLALGKFPRLSAATLAAVSIPTMMARHAFWETQDPEEKVARRQGFLTSVALLGGLFITSADTAGKPGLKWRASKATQQAQKHIQQALPTQSDTQRFAASASNWFEDTQGKINQFVADNQDDWKDTFSGLVDTSSDWLSSAQENTKVAKKSVIKAAAKAQDRAAAAYADAHQASGRAAKKASKRAEKLQGQAAKALKRAQKKIGDVI